MLKFLSVKSIGAFGINVTNQALGLVLFILLTRWLGVVEFGFFMLGWSWLRILMHGGKFGLDLASIKFIPIYVSKQDWPRLNAYGLFTGKIIALASVLIYAAAAAGLLILQEKTDFNHAPLFLLAFAILPIWVLLLTAQSALRALGHTMTSLMSDGMIRPALQIILLFIASLAGLSMTAFNAMGISLIALVIATLVCLFWLKRYWPSFEKPAKAEEVEWLQTAFTLTLISGGMVVMKQADIVMIGALMDVSDVGVYSAAVRLSMLATFVLTAVNMVAGPMIAPLYQKSDHAPLQNILHIASWLIFAGTSVISAILYLFGDFALGLFGAEFIVAKNALHILLIGQMVNAFCGPIGYMMTMTGHHLQTAKIFAGVIVLNIILNAWLIPLYGINGAAVATSAAMVIWNIILCGYVMIKLKLNPTILPVRMTRERDL